MGDMHRRLCRMHLSLESQSRPPPARVVTAGVHVLRGQINSIQWIRSRTCLIHDMYIPPVPHQTIDLVPLHENTVLRTDIVLQTDIVPQTNIVLRIDHAIIAENQIDDVQASDGARLIDDIILIANIPRMSFQLDPRSRRQLLARCAGSTKMLLPPPIHTCIHQTLLANVNRARPL